MEAVLWFFSCQDEDLLDACHLDPARVSSSGRLRQQTLLGDMPRDYWIVWYSVGCTLFFF
jgi:hypothetical protein